MQQPTYKLIDFSNEEGEYLIVSDEEIKAFTPFITKYGEIASGGVTVPKNLGRKIQYSTKLIDPSIPLIRKEQIVFDNLTQQIIRKLTNGGTYPVYRQGYIDGANWHAETYKYTEEDLRKAVQEGIDIACKNTEAGYGTDFDKCEEAKDSYIQSLNQPKEWIVTLEQEEYDFDEDWSEIGGAYETSKTRIKVDKEGYVNILSIKPA